MSAINSSIINRKLLARLFSKIKISTEHSYKGVPCWEWTAYINPANGYGSFSIGYYQNSAHKIIYELFVEAVPERLHCDHLCRNRFCVNPVHIEPVTNRENLLRGVGPTATNAAKTHCKRGHEFTDKNTWVRDSPRGKMRHCRKCAQGQQDAMRRKQGVWDKSLTCKNGHPWTEETTYHPPAKPHWRWCRICRKMAHARSASRH